MWHGLDISHWDGDIDLAAWKKKHGISFVIIKAGGNEKSLGRYKDPKFEANYKKAKAAGLHVGAYYYTVTTDAANARKDADHFLGLLAGKDFDMPCYMDVEDPGQFKLSKRALTDIIKAFCDKVNAGGRYAGLYTSGSAYLNNMYGPGELSDYADWIAWWREKWPNECGDVGMHQVGTKRLSDGRVAYDDVSGYCDYDRCIIDYPARIKSTKTKTETETKETNVATKGTAEAVLAAAEGELGYYAPDDPERGSKYGRWLAKLFGEDWLAGPSSSIWWCCMFVSWCLDQGGAECPGFPTYNTDIAWSRGGKTRAVSKSDIRRGDILIFDWNFSTAATDHIGFATASPVNGYVATIEGNVGNRVCHKTRPLSSIRYVIRPAYKSTAAKPEKATALAVDGAIGPLTVAEWQKQCGTTRDGEISGQVASCYRYFPAINAVTFDGGSGSELVRAIQKKTGATVDGIIGPETVRAIQKREGVDVDGYLGPITAKAIQKSLNAGKWSK